jgi:hypothetical protein
MVRNVSDWSSRDVFSNHIREIALVDLDIPSICLAKGHNLRVIPISPALGHAFKMGLECMVDILLGGLCTVEGCSSILSLWIATEASARVYRNEVLVEISLLTHVFNDAISNFAMASLGPVDLVRECIEETIA